MNSVSSIKKIKTAAYVSYIIILLSGCSSYQHVLLTSNIPQDNNKRFVVSNDTLAVKYAFAGQNCPVNIVIENKQDKPLYIDWSKSAVIVNGQRFSYWADEASINALVTTSGVRWSKEFSYSEGYVSGKISKSEKVSFIPPHSYIAVTPIWLKSNTFPLSKEMNPSRINVYTAEGAVKSNRYTFDIDNSPMAFRSFLSVSFTEDFVSPIYLDHTFWASEIIETSVSPIRLQHQRFDQFYLESASNTSAGVGAAVVVGTVLLVPALILSSPESLLPTN